jgi:hypothetical protein
MLSTPIRIIFPVFQQALKKSCCTKQDRHPTYRTSSLHIHDVPRSTHAFAIETFLKNTLISDWEQTPLKCFEVKRSATFKVLFNVFTTDE